MKNLFNPLHADNVDPDYTGDYDIDPANLVIGQQYIIQSVGNTNWAALGASNPGVQNEVFTATGQASSGTTGLATHYIGYHKRILPLITTNANNALSETSFPQYKENANSVEPDQDYKNYAKEVIPPYADYFDDTTNTFNRYDAWNKPILIGNTTDVSVTVDSDNLDSFAFSTSATDPITITMNSHPFDQGDMVTGSNWNNDLTQLNTGSYYVNVIDSNTLDLYSDAALTTPVVVISGGDTVFFNAAVEGSAPWYTLSTTTPVDGDFWTPWVFHNDAANFINGEEVFFNNLNGPGAGNFSIFQQPWVSSSLDRFYVSDVDLANDSFKLKDSNGDYIRPLIKNINDGSKIVFRYDETPDNIMVNVVYGSATSTPPIPDKYYKNYIYGTLVDYTDELGYGLDLGTHVGNNLYDYEPGIGSSNTYVPGVTLANSALHATWGTDPNGIPYELDSGYTFRLGNLTAPSGNITLNVDDEGFLYFDAVNTPGSAFYGKEEDEFKDILVYFNGYVDHVHAIPETYEYYDVNMVPQTDFQTRRREPFKAYKIDALRYGLLDKDNTPLTSQAVELPVFTITNSADLKVLYSDSYAFTFEPAGGNTLIPGTGINGITYQSLWDNYYLTGDPLHPASFYTTAQWQVAYDILTDWQNGIPSDVARKELRSSGVTYSDLVVQEPVTTSNGSTKFDNYTGPNTVYARNDSDNDGVIGLIELDKPFEYPQSTHITWPYAYVKIRIHTTDNITLFGLGAGDVVNFSNNLTSALGRPVPSTSYVDLLLIHYSGNKYMVVIDAADQEFTNSLYGQITAGTTDTAPSNWQSLVYGVSPTVEEAQSYEEASGKKFRFTTDFPLLAVSGDVSSISQLPTSTSVKVIGDGTGQDLNYYRYLGNHEWNVSAPGYIDTILDYPGAPWAGTPSGYIMQNPGGFTVSNFEIESTATGLTAPTTGTFTEGVGDTEKHLTSIQLISGGNKTWHPSDTTVKAKYLSKWETGIRGQLSAPDITLTFDGNNYLTGATLNATHAEHYFTGYNEVMLIIEDDYVDPTTILTPLEEAELLELETPWNTLGEDSRKVWPTNVLPYAATIDVQQSNIVNIGRGGSKFVKNGGFQKWTINLKYPPMVASDFREFLAAAEGARGQYVPFNLPLKVDSKNFKMFKFHEGATIEAGLIKEAVTGGESTVILEGLEATDVINNGELIIVEENINGKINTVVATSDVNVFGEAKVELAYPVAQNVIAQGNTVEFDPEFAVVTLGDDSFQFSEDTAGYFYLEVTFNFDGWK